MSTPSDQVEDALNAAQQTLIDAANAGPYTPELQAKLDTVTGLFQTVENNMLLGTQEAILNALSGTNDQLKQINTEIETYVSGTDNVAATFTKISNSIGTLVSAITTVVSLGIL
jgi:hypothetical protein